MVGYPLLWFSGSSGVDEDQSMKAVGLAASDKVVGGSLT